MKKIVVLFAVFALAVPLYAQEDVGINLSLRLDGWIEVNYDATAASELVSGFGYNVILDSGATLEGIIEYKKDAISRVGHTGYGIFPGSIDFGTDPNTIDHSGSPVAPPGDPDALGGIGTGGMTIEMATLFEPNDPGNEPATTGKLFAFKVSKPCIVRVEVEPTRGEIVMLSGAQANLVTTPFVVAWNWSNQCYGDADNSNSVQLADFNKWVDGYGKTAASDYNNGFGLYKPEVDFDQDGDIDLADFNTFVDNYGKALAGDCVTVQGYPKPWTW